MRLYRIADARYGPDTGEGARLYGGRWNSPGRAVIYACTTYTGALLEKLVHTGRLVPKHQVCVTFELPDRIYPLTLDPEAYPGWDHTDEVVSRAAGDAWLDSATSLVLLVPSVVFDIERNAMINPAHPDATTLRALSTEPVRWDERLFADATRRRPTA